MLKTEREVMLPCARILSVGLIRGLFSNQTHIMGPDLVLVDQLAPAKNKTRGREERERRFEREERPS